MTKLIQYQDIFEGSIFPEGAFIAIGDILAWPDKQALEHYVCIRTPLPWSTKEYRAGSDSDVWGPAGLLIFFVTGVAPMGRWRFWYHVRKVTHRLARWKRDSLVSYWFGGQSNGST